MRSWKGVSASFFGGVAALLMAASSAVALDIQPRDYRLLPAGTNLALAYYDFAHRGSVKIDNGPTYKDNTTLDSHIGILRYVHYTELGGLPVAVQALLPFGGLTNGKIAGAGLENAGGFGDPYLSVVIWPYHDAEQGTDVAIASYTQPPLGDYDRSRALNLGANRWTQDFQLSLTQSLGKSLTWEVEGDAIFYSANTNANLSGQTLKQDPTFQLQSWLSYDLTPTSYVAAGYNAYFGGKQKVAGTPNGFKTSLQQVRGTYAQFITPSVQALGSLYHDVAVDGGFKRDVGFTLRILKVF